jgi:hypothetical protein
MRRVAIVAVALAAVLVALVYRHAMIDSLLSTMLYPVPAVALPAAPPPPLRPVALPFAAGGAVAGRAVAWERPAAAGDEVTRRPLALFFHGNGENLETMRRGGLFAALDGLALPYLAVEYPGYDGGAGEPSEAGLGAAATAALDWARRHHPDRPVVAVGWSLGAAVALRLAAEHPGEIAAVALLSPWTSLADVAAAHYPAALVRPLLRGRFDSLALAPTVAVPALVVHGELDPIIPIDQGRRLAAALAGPTRWVAIPRAGHNDLFSHPEVWQELAAFLAAVPAVPPETS